MDPSSINSGSTNPRRDGARRESSSRVREKILRLEHHADETGFKKDLKFLSFPEPCPFVFQAVSVPCRHGKSAQMALEEPFQVSGKLFPDHPDPAGDLREGLPCDSFTEVLQGLDFWSMSMYRDVHGLGLRVHLELKSRPHDERTSDLIELFTETPQGLEIKIVMLMAGTSSSSLAELGLQLRGSTSARIGLKLTTPPFTTCTVIQRSRTRFPVDSLKDPAGAVELHVKGTSCRTRTPSGDPPGNKPFRIDRPFL